MSYRKQIIVLSMLLIGIMLAPRHSQAHDMAGMAGMSDMPTMMEHHHHHAMSHEGYKRSVATYQIPDLNLTDASGNEVSLRESLNGSDAVMVNFIFTSCTTICPVMSATFSQVQDKLGANQAKIHMVSISIDPEHDTPARLKEYAKKFGAGPQWSMLTGSIENSIAVQQAFNVYRGDKMNHEPVTFMRKGPDQSWVRFDGFVTADDLLGEYRKPVSD